jgi:hypothetical protein
VFTGWVSTVGRRTPQGRTGIVFLALGVASATAGQVLLTHTKASMGDEGQRQLLAGFLLLFGAVSFGLAARRHPTPEVRLDFPSGAVTAPALAWRNPWSIGWSTAAFFLAALDMLFFVRAGESRTLVIIWLASIVALLVAQLPYGLGLPRIARDGRWYLLGLGMVLIVAALSRSYRLAYLPYNVDGDFAAVGLQARALAIGQQTDIFAFGWADVPMLGYLPPWLMMRLLGPGLVALNASGAVEGLLIIVGVYLLGRDLFHPRVGLIAAALLTVSEAFLAASRQSSYIDPAFFLVFSLYFLLLGLREGRGWAIVLSGLLTALCFEMYHSGKLVVPLVGFILLFLSVFHWHWLKARWWALLLWLLAVIVSFGPMLVVFVRQPGNLASRSDEVFILNPDVIKHQEGVYGVSSVGALFPEQLRRTVLLFNYYADKGTQFALGSPLLDPFLGVLFVLGLGSAAFLARRLGNALLLAWIFLGALLGCFLTANPPFWTRLIVLLPPAALLAAVAANVLYEEASLGLKSVGRPAAFSLPVVAGLLILTWAS